jgi:hypothetical protein
VRATITLAEANELPINAICERADWGALQSCKTHDEEAVLR